MTVAEAGTNDRYTGLSTDTKPVAKIESYFFETDTQKTYIYGKDGWEPWANAVSMSMADSPGLDAFGRARVSQPQGIYDNKNISSRNRNQWEEVIAGLILTYTSLIGTFAAGEEIRGTTEPLPLGEINTDNGSDSMNISVDHNDFVSGDTITGQTSGATATIDTLNTGSNIEFNYNRSSVILTTGMAATDLSIRQNHRYNAYVPGKSQSLLLTFVMGAAVANIKRRIGLFDNLNGLFFEQTDSDIAFVVRSSASGLPVDIKIIQDDWSVDSLDGTGPSKITLDLTKSQILVIDFQWLGAGRIRYGFDIDGRVISCHEVLNANNLDVVYMKTPTLPIRFEISNTDTTSGLSTLEEICSSVISEGGYSLPGLEFTASRGIIEKEVTTTRTPVLAIRLIDESPTGKPNRHIGKLLGTDVNVRTNDAHITVDHIHEPIDITADWIALGGNSAMKYSTNISAITGRPSHTIGSIYVPAAQGGKSSPGAISAEFINLHSFIAQDFSSINSEVFVIYAQARTGTADILASFNWIEFE